MNSLFTRLHLQSTLEELEVPNQNSWMRYFYTSM